MAICNYMNKMFRAISGRRTAAADNYLLINRMAMTLNKGKRFLGSIPLPTICKPDMPLFRQLIVLLKVGEAEVISECQYIVCKAKMPAM